MPKVPFGAEKGVVADAGREDREEKLVLEDSILPKITYKFVAKN